MKRIELSDEYIKSLPLTTNKIEVEWNIDKFFEQYSIVSYYSNDSEFKNLAYEQLADIPCVSVTGIRARWSTLRFPSIKFFVLTKKEKEQDVLNSLRTYESVKSAVDNLSDYGEKLQKRIIASLAINSLGKKKSGKMMYNDGSLLVSDEKNFNAKKSRKELVCLKIEVNEYMILTASTKSFSNPFNDKELRRNKNCVFQLARDIDGDYWSGQSVKPIVIKKFKDGEFDLNKLFILKKNFKDNKNIVPYWPYTPENYPHGKLYVIWQVVDSVNKAFKGLVNITFADSKVLHYDECLTGDAIVSMMENYFTGKTLSFDDSFNSRDSKNMIKQFKSEINNIIGDAISFPKKQTANDLLIKLCEPKDEESINTLYTKSLGRLSTDSNALQHLIFYNDKKKDAVDTARVRRILIELLVKDCLVHQKMPKDLTELILGWNFTRYKINQGNVHGASFDVNSDGIINITQYGLSQNDQGMDFDDFIKEKFNYDSPDKIHGARDYMALQKNGNVYLIIDTDEIPILDVTLIDEGYNQVVNSGETVSMFKRKASVHEYLRGYIGFHLWKSEGLDGEPDGSFSYISGNNKERLKITHSTRMDKMPRARRIFILSQERPENIENDVMEIAAMLKFGFGRWDELMTYPFPFKFLQEYLDNEAEKAFSIHWKDITYKKDL